MEPADLILHLKEMIASPSAADVFKRIYLDPLLFQAFDEEGALEKAMNACGADSQFWTPDRISFALTGVNLTPEELTSLPLQPIQAELRQQVSALYQKVLRRQAVILSLEDAVFLALALRERRRLTDSWSGLVKEITRNYTDRDFSVDNWATALTIAYWICPDQSDFLQELDSLSEHLDSISFFILLSRILLSTPGGVTESQTNLLIEAIQAMDEPESVKALEWLYGYGYEDLTKTISARLLGDAGQSAAESGEPSTFVTDPLEKTLIFQKLDHLANQEKVNHYQYDSIVRPVFLTQQEELLRQAQARMEAQKARLENGEAKIQAWKKVVGLVPESDLAKAELAAAYLEGSDKSSPLSIQFGDSTHPFVLSVRAWIAFSHGNLIDSELFLDRLIQEISGTTKPDSAVTRRIVDIVGRIDLPEKMDILLAALPEDLSTQAQAIRLRARLASERSDYKKAKHFAAASLLFNENDLPSRRILARSHQEQEEYDQAIQEWEKILSLAQQPEMQDQLAYADCAIKAGKPDLAIATCKTLLERNPSEGSAYQFLGDAYLQMNDREQAGQYFEKAVALSPELEETWKRLASFHLANGDRVKAQEILNTAIKAVPDAATLNYMLGKLYLESGANAEAIPLFQKAYRTNPRNIDFVHTLGESLQNAGQWIDAEALYGTAAKHFPFDQAILFGHAKSLLKLGKKSDALIPMQHLVELQPESTDIYLVFGHLVLDDLIPDYEQIDPEDAETIALLDYSREILQDASERYPTDAHIQLLLADNLSRLGDQEAARELYASLTEQIYTMPIDLRWRVSYGLGLTSGRMGEFEVALAALQEAANQNPENYQIQQQLAEAYLRANLGQAALQAAQQALSINPKDTDNLIWYAEFCTRSHDLQEALSTLDALIKIQPENVELRIKLGTLQIQVGEIEIAKSTYRKLVSELKLTSGQYQLIAANLATQKEYQEATGYLRMGIQEDPQSSLPLLMDLVQYEQKLGDLSSALNTLETAIALDPQNRMLQVVKADMLAFGGNTEEAIQALEGVTSEVQAESPETIIPQEQHLAVMLRMIYLYRKSGAILRAMELANACLEQYPGEGEAVYLLADMAYQRLDLRKAEQILSENPIHTDTRSQIADLALILLTLVNYGEGKTAEALDLYKSRELNSRWYVWKSAIEALVSKSDELDLKTISTVHNEVNGLTLTDIEQLLPAREKHRNKLPDMPAYDPLANSPLLASIIAQAAVATGGFTTALGLFDQIRDQFPYEINPMFSIAKTYVVQAEQFRLAEKLRTRRHSPPADSLSLGSFEAFEQMILATERVCDEPMVKAWHDRGMAAFYPTIDNFGSVTDKPEFAEQTKFVVGKLALENKVADMMQILDTKAASLQERVEAALLVLDKAPQDALQMLEPVVEQLSIRPAYLAAYAMAASECGHPDSALDAIENALVQWPDEPEWHLMAARLCAQSRNASGALYHWKLAADLEPENYEVILEMGKGALQFEDIMQAIQYLRKAAHLDPVNYQPWLYMAQAYHMHGDINQAIASIERSVTLAPNQSEPLVYSAQLSLEAGHSDEALKKIDAALRLNPKDVDGLILKAKALHSNGHTDEALEWIAHSLGKVANSLPLLLARSEIIQRKDGQKAYLKSLQEIAQDYPKDPKVLQMYGQALAENGQPADALHITQLALKADPDQLGMHLLAGRLLRSTGQLDQAIDHFSACIHIDPEHVESYLEMAKTYQERRDFPKASSLFEKVIEIAPKDYRGYYQLGLLLRDAKDYRGAEGMLRKASELTKDDVNILRQLGAIIALNLVHNPQEASIHS